MPYSLEIEFKNMITQDTFFQLSNMFNFTSQDFILQQNYYYDFEDILSEKQMSLRIRRRLDVTEITLKQKAVQSQHAQIEITLPFEQPIEETYTDIESFLPKEILNHLAIEQVELTQLDQIGRIDTLRKEFEYQKGLLCIDYNRFNGEQEDYEIEFEYSSINDGETIFDNFLVQHNIPRKPAKNKIARMRTFQGLDDLD